MTNFNESKLSKIIARAIVAPEDRAPFTALATPVYCPSNNGVRANRLTIIKPFPIATIQQAKTGSSDSPSNVDGSYSIGGDRTNITTTTEADVTHTTEFTPANNKMDITLDKSIELTYNVPYEVDLETDVNLQDLIKADALVQFKKAVNQEIATLINSNKASITSVSAGTTLADTIGTLIANNIIDGTGCKFSVYSYNNGAPVEYIQSGDQLKFRNLVQNEDGSFYFADIQEANVPAMYYINKPSLILDETNFTDLQVALCDGTVKRYAAEKINFDVDSTSNLTTTIGADGIFGTNDSFAVAFTEPHISITPKHTDFTYDVSVVIYFGVGLIYLDNLQKITST